MGINNEMYRNELIKLVMKRLIRNVILLVSLAYFGACSKAELPFVLRSTDNLTFGYAASTQTFTVCTNGAWSVAAEDADWVTLSPTSGTGDGETREEVTVTVKRNMGDARTGRVAINAADEVIYIDLTQNEGHMVLGEAALNKTLVKGVALEDAIIAIPYTKGVVDEDVMVSVSLTGPGAVGINPAEFTVQLPEETGTLEVPLEGTPQTDGAVTITVELLGLSASLESRVHATDPGNVIYLEQHFDLFVLGGDHVGKAPGQHLVGEWPTMDGKRVLPENPQLATSGTPNTDGTGDYFNTMHPSFVVQRGLEGWTGMRVYERPGYPKIGTAGSTDGYLATPPLTGIAGTDDIRVTFKAARWSENATADQNAKLMIKVANGGTAEIEGTEIDLTPGWQEMSFIVRDATPETVIEFRAKAQGNNRFMLDDIVVRKSTD